MLTPQLSEQYLLPSLASLVHLCPKQCLEPRKLAAKSQKATGSRSESEPLALRPLFRFTPDRTVLEWVWLLFLCEFLLSFDLVLDTVVLLGSQASSESLRETLTFFSVGDKATSSSLSVSDFGSFLIKLFLCFDVKECCFGESVGFESREEVLWLDENFEGSTDFLVFFRSTSSSFCSDFCLSLSRDSFFLRFLSSLRSFSRLLSDLSLSLSPECELFFEWCLSRSFSRSRMISLYISLQSQSHHNMKLGNWFVKILGPKLLLPMGCVKLGEKNCVHLPSVGEQTAN